MPSAFGERIRELRKRKKMTLEKLAADTASSKSYIWELENREDSPRPSAEKLSKIAEVLGVTVDYLMGNESELQSAEDVAFFRKYSQMTPEARARIRRMAKALDDEE